MSEMKKLMEAIDSIQTEDEYVTKQVVGHEDNETRMMQRDLLLIRDNADELLKMMDELKDGDYPHWWQAKLVKASEFLDTIKHFLEGELELGPRSSDSDDVEMFRKEIAMGDGFKDFD